MNVWATSISAHLYWTHLANIYIRLLLFPINMINATSIIRYVRFVFKFLFELHKQLFHFNFHPLQDLFIDPIWEVPPMTAFMHTVTQIIITPLQMLSTALGEATANFMRE